MKHEIVCDICKGCAVDGCEAACTAGSGEAHQRFWVELETYGMSAKQLKEWEAEQACKREVAGRG